MSVDGTPQSPWSFVRGLEPVSFCDWTGHVAAVLFLGGCNLRCPTCHNRTLAWQPESLPPIPRRELMKLLRIKVEWIDGLVVSGGEPTCTPALEDLLTDLAALGLPIKLDTNGLKPELLEKLLAAGLVDCFAVDVKGPWRKYPGLTGGVCSPDRARQSLERIFALAVQAPGHFLFRLTEVPDLSRSDIAEVEACLPAGFALHRQAFRPVDRCRESNRPNIPQTRTEAPALK